MAITKIWLLPVLILSAGQAWSREAATPAECQAFAAQPPLSSALAKARDATDVRAQMTLADAWSDAGCYNEAVAALQTAVNANPGVAELQTRLRVAKSLVGEEHFFDDLDRADRQAKVKRDAFRCNSLGDLEACNEAVRLQPDDPALFIGFGDALMRSRRYAEALQQYRRAEPITTDKQALVQKIRAAETQLPGGSPELAANSNSAKAPPVSVEQPTPAAAQNAAPKTASRVYSNVSPQGQSH